ncbi:MAG: hypothetical protein ACREBS_00205, partial [Nitrososphaerales archaeon]
LVIYTPQGAAAPANVAQTVARSAAGAQKPVLTVWMGEDRVREARRFSPSHIPTYPTPEEAVRRYMYMYAYHRRNLDLLYKTP